ncbi:hypothetical protein ASPCADRAFT_206109 [Aspergillus carbonarius ITEM 5010]|uniref:Uncharacterized protein n=1 Tax=Aspergillus carbonarius (strain ITEM 5010) TaxID=602072 RepID=A0A1R3RS33_ASPC5|nr:hypothetical protein ASPCADRAFT_206109 [Aspergillus carbonarius ITEM 5010]
MAKRKPWAQPLGGHLLHGSSSSFASRPPGQTHPNGALTPASLDSLASLQARGFRAAC